MLYSISLQIYDDSAFKFEFLIVCKKYEDICISIWRMYALNYSCFSMIVTDFQLSSTNLFFLIGSFIKNVFQLCKDDLNFAMVYVYANELKTWITYKIMSISTNYEIL